MLLISISPAASILFSLSPTLLHYVGIVQRDASKQSIYTLEKQLIGILSVFWKTNDKQSFFPMSHWITVLERFFFNN